MRSILLTLLLLQPAAIAVPSDIEIRVSVKFVLDPSGSRTWGSVSSDADVQAQIDIANWILEDMGRGYALELVEIVDLFGVSSWFDSCDQDGLDAAASASPALYAFRSDAINIYVTNGSCAGSCAFPDSGQDVILVGRQPQTTTFLHEIGHFVGLCHTQGCPCGPCTASGTCSSPASDNIADTLPDMGCWSQDDIAQFSFGLDYADLSASLKAQVDDVFYNVMSYHGVRDRFSQGQCDKFSDGATFERFEVVSGGTYFVDGSFFGGFIGSSVLPFRTFGEGWSASGPGDVVLVRPGTYSEGAMILTEARCLLSPGGSSVIR